MPIPCFPNEIWHTGGVPRQTKTSSPAATERYMVPVVRSTFRILQELSRSGGLGLNEITQRTRVAKSTVFRVLSTLHNLGYVVRDDRRNYHVSPSLGNLAGEAAVAEALRRTALPHMLRLRDEFGETVNLGHLDFDKVVYLEVVPSEYALRFSERPGASIHAHASALGKAILAFSPPDVVESLISGRALPRITRNTICDTGEFRRELKRTRERGYSLDKGETTLLATCLGAPILDVTGTAIAALSISGPASRFNPRRNAPVIEALLNAAKSVSDQFRPPVSGRADPAPRAGGARRQG